MESDNQILTPKGSQAPSGFLCHTELLIIARRKQASREWRSLSKSVFRFGKPNLTSGGTTWLTRRACNLNLGAEVYYADMKHALVALLT